MTGAWMLFLVLGGLASALVAAWVTRPLWTGDAPERPWDPQAVELLLRREAVLADLRDLDAEWAAGRVAAAEYQPRRADLVAQGAATLAALDALAETSGLAADRRLAQVERDVAAARVH
jgi:hypothetical protein